MANEKTQTFYEVLGVDKTADERSIKKAYFTLVRKYPPETHPEEFKKIREAYEVLSNPVSRKDYDSVDEYDKYGEQISARLKVGMEAMDRGDYRAAQREFVEVLRLQPQLHFARDLLGMAYLNNDQPKDAQAQFEALVAAQPENPVYHLHKGYSHYHQKHYVPAMAAYREAQRLDGLDTRVLVAMADCLSGQKQYEAALAELDRAINMDGQVDFQDFIFFMRKVQIQLLRNRADLAETDLDQIFKILPPDVETRKYVATRLASLAADLFAMKRSVDANRLLERCKQLDSTRASMSFQFPSRTTVPIKSLPASSQTWIANHGKEYAAGMLKHNAWTAPIVLLIFASITQLVALGAGFNTTRLWDSGTQLNMFLLLVGAPLFLALGISRVRRVAKSPFGKYTTIHPLHLMQVDVDKVTLWPLVNLHDVSLTHHSTNGIYQYTAVRMDFAGTFCNLTIRGQQASVDWANRLLGQRRRVLELMSAGLLDAEEGFDLVPPEQLKGTPKKPAADKSARDKMLRYYGAFAGAGVLLAIIAIPLNRGAAERDRWQSCTVNPSIQNYRGYLERFPSGKHAGQAREAINEKYDDAIAQYKARAKDGDQAAKDAIVSVIEALKTSNTQRVKITYDSSFDFSNKEKIDGVIPPDTAFSNSYNKNRERSITASLQKAFGEILSHDVVEFNDGSESYTYDDYRYSYSSHYGEPLPKVKDSAITFVIKYHVGPSGSIYESTTGQKKKLYGILFDWDFAIHFDGEANDRYKLALSSAPTKHIRYTTSDYEANSDIIPYTKMAESSFEEFGRKIAGAFGVAVPVPADPDESGGVVGGVYGGGPLGGGAISPSLQKALDNLRKNGSMSPETQRLLDDLAKGKRARNY